MIVHDRRSGTNKATFSQPDGFGVETATDRISGQAMGGHSDQVDNLFGKSRIRRALYQAAFEGRLHDTDADLLGVKTGQYKCGLCGMRAWTLELADRCCLDEGSHTGLYTDKQNGSFGAVAVLNDQQALICGLAGYALDRGIKTRRAFAIEIGMGLSSLTRMQTYSMRWIMEKNWKILLGMFDGAVPGCEAWPIVEVDDELS